MTETHKLTAEAAERLETEVTRLEGEDRREIAERIGIAREWGDLKENAEYHAAKEEAAMLEAKIARMRDQLRTAEIVEAAGGSDRRDGLHGDLHRPDAGKEVSFTLVPARRPTRAKPAVDRLTGRPCAGGLVGRDEARPGDPAGRRTMIVKAWSSRDGHRDLP